MLKSRADRSALGAAPDVAILDVCLKFLSPKTENDPSTISAQEACFGFAPIIIYSEVYILATTPKSKPRNRILIIKYMSYTIVYVSTRSSSKKRTGQ